MFLSSEDFQTGTKPLSLTWARLFANNEAKQLVVAFSNYLMVFEFIEEELKLLFRQSLHAPLLEMHVIPREAPLGERLLLVLDECNKLSVVECINQRFVNVELYNFPASEYRHELSGPDSTDHKCRIAVDPEGRCFGLRLFRNYLALVPQSNNTISNIAADVSVDENVRLPNWTTSFAEMDERFRNVFRITFLPGYIEPTLALMGYASTYNTIGRSSSQRDQVWFALVTCQLVTQQFNTIYYLSGLPNDLEEMVSVPRPIGGVLAYGVNSMVHLEQGSPGIGLALNPYAPRLSSFKYSAHNQPANIVLLNNFASASLDDSHVLFGNGLVLRMKKSGRFVNKMELSKSEEMQSFCFSLNGDFIAAHDGDQIVIFSKKTPSAVPMTKNSNISSVAVEDTDIYLAELAQEAQHATSGRIELERRCAIRCTSQVQDFCLVQDFSQEVPNHHALGRKQTAVVTDTGSLYVYPHTLPFNQVTSFEIPGSQQIWTVPVTKQKSQTTLHLLVSSTPTATLVLVKDEDRIKEVESSGFYLEGPTVFAGTLLDRILQVTPEKTLLLDCTNYRLLYELEGRFVKAARFDKYVALLEENGDFGIYSIEKDNVNKKGGDELVKINGAKDIRTFDFDHGRRALWAVDGNGTVSCLAEPFDKVVFVNSNFSALPPILSNHLQGVPSVKSAPYPIREVRILGDLLVVLASNQLVAYRITVGCLPKVYSERLGKGDDYAIFTNDLDLLILLGASQSLVFHAKALRSIPFASENVFSSISFLSLNEFIGVREGRVSICKLDDRYQWSPVLGLALHSKLAGSLSHVLYHPTADCFLVVSRELVDWKLPTDEYSSISDQLEADLPDNFVLPKAYEYKLAIVSPMTWGMIDTLGLREYETVLQMRLSILDTKQTSTGKKAFVTMGTALNKGEDRPVRGRAIVVDIVEVVPEPGRPETNLKLRQLAFQEVKGPVMTHCELDGCLLLSLGSKIIVHALENDDALTGIAFVDSGVASISSAVLKNYFVLGDMNMGASFFAFQKEPPKIAALGKDVVHHSCLLQLGSVEFCVRGSQVLMVGGDPVASLLHFYSYAPMDRRTGSGQKLLYLGCLRLSSPPIRMVRTSTSISKTLGITVLCADGALKRLLPVDDVTFRKGLALTARLTSQLLTPQAGGLLPRSVMARPFGADPEVPHPLYSSLIDLSYNRLLVLDLSVAQQTELARITNLDLDDLFL